MHRRFNPLFNISSAMKSIWVNLA